MNPTITIIQGDAIENLRGFADGSVHCCVTSPPYWGLRDYGVSGQLGLEKTPEEYVAKMVEVFREVRRVLRDDGTLWLNLGDSYASQPPGKCSNPFATSGLNGDRKGHKEAVREMCRTRPARDLSSLKPKDLCGIPWAVAKALQSPYYTGKIRNEMNRVWLGAIIDAEGSICGFTHHRKDNGQTRHGIHITVTNSNRAILDRCFDIWPTTREEHNHHSLGHLGSLPTWRWIPHGMDEKSSLLRELYPYFTGKKKQALLAWNFLEISRTTRGRNKRDEGDSNREKYAWIVHALSRLNRLETVDIPDWCKEPLSMFEPGWFLRQDILWSKPNPMPESVTDRCTKSHEYIFLLTKSARYYFDAEAIKEPSVELDDGRERVYGGCNKGTELREQGIRLSGNTVIGNSSTRNKRSVWTVPSSPYSEAHFATFPPDLIKPCILAGTSARGCCPTCGAPWERVVDRLKGTPESFNGSDFRNGKKALSAAALADVGQQERTMEVRTIGWEPGCECGYGQLQPCTVLDPFGGSGTTGMVSLELGRKAVLIELNPDYVKMAEHRTNVTPGLALA